MIGLDEELLGFAFEPSFSIGLEGPENSSEDSDEALENEDNTSGDLVDLYSSHKSSLFGVSELLSFCFFKLSVVSKNKSSNFYNN